MKPSHQRLFLVHMIMKSNFTLKPHPTNMMFSDWLQWLGRTSAFVGMNLNQILAASSKICELILTFRMLHLHVKATR